MSSKCKKTFVQNVNTDLPPFDSKSEGCACIAGNHPHLYSAYTPAPSTELNRKNNQEHQQESENMEKVENMGFCCGIY
jgi:hypothetical protein